MNNTEVFSIIDQAGGFLNFDDHTIGGFYSHSNYVDLWADYDKDNDKGVMPEMSELDKDSPFGKIVNDQLKTTGYPDENDPSYPHSKKLRIRIRTRCIKVH